MRRGRSTAVRGDSHDRGLFCSSWRSIAIPAQGEAQAQERPMISPSGRRNGPATAVTQRIPIAGSGGCFRR